MSQLGRYEIIEQMGTGAMGNVYRARDMSLDRPVALKTIRTGVDVAPEVRQRFYREARACARLQHPNIITVFDMGEVENTAYIAMELLEGADFRKIIQERRPIPVESKLAICVEVCDAIAHAHRHGVVHRDIKPSNLFLTNEGRTKVLDFGIARLPSSKLTVIGQILGTPNYMAPEQILARPSDGRADLFSAAVVFFEFLTYNHPFQSPFIPRRIVQGEPDSLFDGNTSLPVILETVLTRGLAKDPNQRYQTGDEFAADLRTVLDALRGNASPTFSGIQLPSQQAILPTRIQPEVVSNIEPPAGQDPQEWRLSEALRLLPDFEAAIDQRNAAKAHSVVVDLESRLSGDLRFGEALRLCRSRLQELDSETLLMPPGSMPSRTERPEPATVPPESQPLPAAVRFAEAAVAEGEAVDLDASIFASPDKTSLQFSYKPAPAVASDPPLETAAPPPAVAAASSSPVAAPAPITVASSAPSAASTSTATVVTAPTPTVAPPPGIKTESSRAIASKPSRTIVPNPRRRKLLVLCGVIAVCAVVVWIVVAIASRAVPIEPSKATAVVQANSADIFASSGALAKKIVSVPKGTQLNILQLPTSPAQEWVNVQVVKPKVQPPGFARVAALGEWRSQTGVTALALLRMFGPSESGSEEAISGQIQELNNLANHFKGESAAKEARLDATRLTLSLARRQKSSGGIGEDLRSKLTAARQELILMGGDELYSAKALNLNRQIDDLLADKPAPVTAPPVAPPVASHSAPAATPPSRQPVASPSAPVATNPSRPPVAPPAASHSAPAATPTSPPDVAGLLAKARKLRSDGDFQAAEQTLRQILKLSPKNKDAQGLLDKIRQAHDSEK